jgi:two-component system, OmpR family, alkaline phosphatase synthesis response regulator PhoP
MIYLVEDDNSIRELVAYTLNTAGLQTREFEKPSLFWSACKDCLPDLILLDIMLPEEDGMQILQKLRQQEHTEHIPVLMLTAKSTEYDKVMGLDKGADDYLTKPFGMMELLARVKALLRRTKNLHTVEQNMFTLGDLVVNKERYEITKRGQVLTVTKKEFDLLWYLLQNQNRVLTREQLLNRIWGYDFDGESRTVDVHIRTLRQKLGEYGKYIETVRGVGYKIGGIL